VVDEYGKGGWGRMCIMRNGLDGIGWERRALVCIWQRTVIKAGYKEVFSI
jgi:hypothetical protein